MKSQNRLLTTGMKFTMDLFQAIAVHMSINLGGPDIGMTKQLLYHPEIGPLTENMGGKRMPESMGADFFLNPGAHYILLHQTP